MEKNISGDRGTWDHIEDQKNTTPASRSQNKKVKKMTPGRPLRLPAPPCPPLLLGLDLWVLAKIEACP
jgi:hypothetical protein